MKRSEKRYRIRDKLILFIVIFITQTEINSSLFAQNSESKYGDSVFNPQCKTIQLHKKGWELSYPVIDLNKDETLLFSFDELGSETKSYYYTVIHCNSNWTPSDLGPADYIEGYTKEHIRDYSLSFNTTYDYVHYSVEIPNEQLSFKISGNYVLLVYIDGQRENLVITRRFYVVEPNVEINAVIKRPKSGDLYDTGQEIDFKIGHRSYPFRDPFSDIKVVLMQNFRNDNIISDLKPLFINPDELDYTYDDKNAFGGGKEFRYFDIKSVRYQAEFIDSIKFQNPYYHFYLSNAESRVFTPYYFVNDFNGRYYVDVQEGNNKDIEADYVYVHFLVPAGVPVVEGEVYVFGGLTDWGFNESNKMIYNFEKHGYELILLLKQGFYNYQIVYVPDGSKVADLDYFEGNHYETENDYQIFVYHTDINLRYDKLIGYLKLNTLDPNSK